MSRFFTAIVFSTLLACVAVSCVSAPAPAPTPAPAPMPTATDVPAAPTDLGQPESAADPTTSGEAVSETPSSTEPPATAGEASPPNDKPANPELVPEAPSAEKLLYFYPEPDMLIPATPEPAPVSPPAQAKVAEPTAPKPAAKPEPKAPAPAAKPVEEKPAAGETQKAEVLPGIWEAEPESPAMVVVPARQKPAPSRSVTVSVGQNLDVWYPGAGWVFLGDASAQNGLGYQNRKLDKGDTLFAFKALKEGAYVLDFSRFDVLEDAFSEDSLSVTVTASLAERRDRVRAPDYRAPVVSTPVADGTTGSAGATGATDSAGVAASTAASTTVSAPTVGVTSTRTAARAVTPATSAAAGVDEPTLQAVNSASTVAATQPASGAADALDKARKALAAGDAVGALAQLDAFFSVAIESLDEGWFLRGQAYEANGSARDVRKALAAYETLTAAFPESARWKDADARIRYLKQFYLRIR